MKTRSMWLTSSIEPTLWGLNNTGMDMDTSITVRETIEGRKPWEGQQTSSTRGTGCR